MIVLSRSSILRAVDAERSCKISSSLAFVGPNCFCCFGLFKSISHYVWLPFFAGYHILELLIYKLREPPLPHLCSQPKSADEFGVLDPISSMQWGACFRAYSIRILGPLRAWKTREAIAQTRASRRSGDLPFDRPVGAKSHISSSSSVNRPACLTRPCSYSVATGSARTHFPRVACTGITGTPGSTWWITLSTMSPPWLTSAISVSACSACHSPIALPAQPLGVNPDTVWSPST